MKNNTKRVVEEIIHTLHSFFDITRLQQAPRFHPTKLTVIGVKVPDVKKTLSKLLSLSARCSIHEKWLLVQQFIKTDIFECYHLAYEFIYHNIPILEFIQKKDYTLLTEKIDNWVLADVFGLNVSGQAWREKYISNDFILSWQQSDNYWIRRIALVSTIPLNLRSKGGIGDSKRTLMLCKNAIEDPHPKMAKALSWALRELSKVDPSAVREFIEKYKKDIPLLTYREVMNKLKTGRKN